MVSPSLFFLLVVDTVAVLQACADAKVGHIVYASSSSVYGARTEAPFSEGDRTDTPASLVGQRVELILTDAGTAAEHPAPTPTGHHQARKSTEPVQRQRREFGGVALREGEPGHQADNSASAGTVPMAS